MTSRTLIQLPDDWDLGGAWITDYADVLSCDHAASRHHSHIAFDHFVDEIEPDQNKKHDKFSIQIAVDLAYDVGWLRISTRGKRSISIEWRTDLQPKTKAALIKHLRGVTTPFENYEIESPSGFHQFNNPKKMIAYIRQNA